MKTQDAKFTGARLSPHLARSPEGYLIALDCIVARTAVTVPQMYAAHEVVGTGSDQVAVYRLPEDVYDEQFLASLEGKIVTDGHPGQFLTRDNYQNYLKGILINPRRGPQLSNGEGSIVCDMVIFDSKLAQLIELGHTREISLGYGCEYVRHKDGFKQIHLTGNHAAVVPLGRAGTEVRVRDSAENVKASKRLTDYIEGVVADFRKGQGQVERPSGNTFHSQLLEQSEAYRSYDRGQSEGQSFSEQCRQAGKELGAKFRPANLPLREEQAGPAEDFAAAARRIGRQMQGTLKFVP